MKKYISIFSLLTVLLMQSCERSHADINSENSEKIKIIHTLKKEKSFPQAENKTSSVETDTDDLDTGDDDEPRRDKQHWRISRDTIW